MVVLIEHQSTINENMPLRFLIYLGRLYEKIIDNKSIYRKKGVSIPAPEFIVLYNGKEEFPDQKVLRLSNLYSSPELGNEFDLPVKVFNVTAGRNKDILQKCRTLAEYAALMAKILEYEETGMSRANAVKEAVDYCIRHDVLREFLEKQRSEVINMLFTEFNIDDAKEVWQEEAMEDGIEKGIEKAAFGMLEKKCDDAFIVDVLCIPTEKLLVLKEKFQRIKEQ